MTALIVATLATGCGGSDDDQSSQTTPSTGTPAASVKTDGKAIFTDEGCSSCHTLAAAGAKGISGPNLDDRRPDADEAAEQVTEGGGGMPGYGGRLTPDEIQAVSEFIATNAGR